MSDYLKLAVPNRASFWMQSFAGKDYYNPNQFLTFTSESNVIEQQQLYDGFTWMYDKLINKIDTPKPAPYLFVQAVKPSGKAAAIYTIALFVYDEQGNLINPRGLAALQGTCIATMERWASDHKQTMNPPVFQQNLPKTGNPNNEDEILVVTSDFTKPTSL